MEECVRLEWLGCEGFALFRLFFKWNLGLPV